MLVQEHPYKSPDIVRFLKHLLRHIPGKLLVIWDGAPIHRGQPVKDFLAQGGRNLSIGLRHGAREITDAPPLTRPARGSWAGAD